MEYADRRPAQWIEVDGEALIHNLELFRKIVGKKTDLLAVVKANAYGHGLAEIAPIVENVAGWCGVHTAGEARELRALGMKNPILVMGFVPPSELHGAPVGVISEFSRVA
jgi:alanine racemase